MTAKRKNPGMDRISTGIQELDSLICGGYPLNKAVLVTGGPGVGKTILAMQFVNSICSTGRKCLYLATEEAPEDLEAQAEMLGIPLHGYTEDGLLEIIPALAQRMDDVHWQRNRNSPAHLFNKPLAAIKNADSEFLIFDNIGSYTFETTIGSFREQMDYLVNAIGKKGMTAMLVSDETMDERYSNAVHYSVYGVIHLFKRENPFTGNVERLMNVVKMRGTETPLGYVRSTIAGTGIKIQPPAK